MRAAYVLISGLTLLLAAANAGEAPRNLPPLPVDLDPNSGVADPRPRTNHTTNKPPPGSATTAPGRKSPGRTSGPAPAPATGPTAEKAPSADGKPADGKPAAQLVDPDTIILDNEQRFHGTILSNQDNPDQVSINTGSGVMIIRRERIKEVVYGLTARMGRVKADDLSGLLDLAHWCRNNRRNTEALALLTKAIALPECDLPSRGLYAQLVDEVHGAEASLPLYIAYRNAGGNDPGILARLAELEKARRLWEDQMRALGLDPGASAETGAPVASATASQVEEGYEKYTWVGDNPKFANPVVIGKKTLATPDGPRNVLQADCQTKEDSNEYSKAAVILRSQLNLGASSKLNLLAANRSTKELRVSIAVKTGNAWTYFEGPTQTLPATTSGQEFQQLTFDLGAANFKALASGWAHSAKVSGLDQVKELQILIHNGKNEGSLWLAGIGFSDKE